MLAKQIAIFGSLFLGWLALRAFTWAGWGSEELRVGELLVGAGYVVASGLLIRIARDQDAPLPLWLRYAAVVAFVFALPLLNLGFDDVRWPREVSVTPPLVMGAAAPLAWGSYVALGRDDVDGLRLWLLLCVLAATGLSFVFQILPLLPGVGSGREFEPLYLLPTAAVGAAALVALRDPAPVGPRLARWALGYVVLLLAMFIFDSYQPDRVWAFFQFIFHIPFFGVAFFLMWISWKLFSGSGWPRGFAVLGARE